MKEKFNVNGMSCAACSAAVEKAVSRLDGVETAQVNLMQKSMLCDYDEQRVSQGDIIAAVEKAGYSARIFDSAKQNEPEKDMSAANNVKKRLIISAAFLVPLMYVSMGHMAGLPVPHFLHGTENAFWFSLVQLLLTLPIVVLNRKFFVNGFAALVHLAPNMDSLIAVGSTAALVYGAVSVGVIFSALSSGDLQLAASYASNLYFESAAMILVLVTLGKYLEERSVGKTSSAINGLMRLAPDTATVIRDGKEETIPTELINAGDLILIKPGERVPVDGTVVSGFSFVDESALTGESVAVEKTEGSSVMSASVNKNGTFTFRAEKVGSDTVLARIIELVENASAGKAPVSRLADKIAGIFVPIVMAVAAVTAAAWLFAGEAQLALKCAISVLVVSCPCALGLATPVAITVATGRCASKGILIKSAAALEELGKINTVVLDKTGTVTAGTPQVTDVFAAKADEESLVAVAAAMERASEHPLAQAILDRAKGLELPKVEHFETVPGRGIKATLGNESCFAGNAAFMNEMSVDISAFTSTANKLYKQGKTVMFFARSGVLLGIIAARDEIKDTAAQAIKQLHALGQKVVLLTEDNAVAASAIGNELGIKQIVADVMPQDKEKYISALREKGKKTAMVGDGINDSPALATADVGIAIGSGTDIAIDSADIVLMGNNLCNAAEAISFSRKTMRNIKQNLFWAFFYNTVCIPVAAGVLYPLFGITLSPMLAAAAMSFSSLFVVSNALRLYKK